MTRDLARNERILLLLSALLLATAIFLPLWKIEIWAPQYPEGLTMRIGAGEITGNVDQINILNHYIGMKKIASSDIPELRVLPWVMSALAALGAAAAAFGRRRVALAWLSVFAAAGAIGFFDFFLWGYDYGHNLSPDAPIKIPGLSYQPPLIGHKLILNIHSYSLPDWGSYLLLAAFAAAALGIFGRPLFGDKMSRAARAGETKWPRATRGTGSLFSLALAAISLALASVACTPKPEPIVAGEDRCERCHMTISDRRFAAEVVTEKGRVLKYDSIGCLLHHHAEKPAADRVWVVDHFHPETMLPAKDARFLVGSGIAGPMGPGPIAAGDAEALKTLAKTKSKGEVVDWASVPSSP